MENRGIYRVGRYAYDIHPNSYFKILQHVMKKDLPELVKVDRTGGKDALLLYIYLLTYIDHRTHMENGADNKKWGYAYPSFDRITHDTNISRRRLKRLFDLLRRHQLIDTTSIIYNGKKRNFYKIIDPTSRAGTKENSQSWTSITENDEYVIELDSLTIDEDGIPPF